MRDKKYKYFKCDDCPDDTQVMRNCAGQYKHADFRFEFKNKEIIYECPQSFFDDVVREWYHLFTLRQLMQKTGIMVDSENITLFELNVFDIINSEFNAIDNHELKTDKKTK